MKITLKTLSPVLFGSGEGGALVNVDLTVHESGLPYVPGRRLKGLLRESLLEVLEMFGEGRSELLLELFGTSGKSGPVGKLSFPNLFLPEWNSLLKELRELKKAHPVKYHPHNLRKHFTQEIPQTAMKDGVAKDGSLRMYRVLNPDITFEAELAGADKLSDDALEYLGFAVQNLRSAGTRRNKGFGDIKVQLEESRGRETAGEGQTEVTDDALAITIETLGPVLIPAQTGDQNTLNTRRHIPGTVLRGMVAGKLIRQMASSKDAHPEAHLDALFYNAVLSGQVTFGNCFPSGGKPIPMNYTQPKGKKTDELFDSLSDHGQDVKLRPVSGFGKVEHAKLKPVSVKTAFMFHNSRPNRTAGRQMGESDAEQNIFYYEAISAGQSFSGTLHGKREVLQQLVEKIGSRFETRIGRSRSAQYGRVRIELSATKKGDGDLSQGEMFDLVCQSPLLLQNDVGEFSPTKEMMSRALGTDKLIEIQDLQVKFQTIENFNAVWLSKTGQDLAYKTGSVFRLKVKPGGFERLKEIRQKGLGARRSEGFGKVDIQPVAHFPKTKAQSPEKTKKPSEGNIPQNAILKDYHLARQKESNAVAARQLAIKDARGFAKSSARLSNSLVSRLHQMLSQLTGNSKVELELKWKAKMEDVEKRAAGKALQDAHIWDHLLKLKRAGKGLKKPADPVLYWKTYFETLRTIQNQDESK